MRTAPGSHVAGAALLAAGIALGAAPLWRGGRPFARSLEFCRSSLATLCVIAALALI